MIKNRNEVGFTLCRLKSGQLVHGPVSEGTPTSVTFSTACPPGASLVALFHTHPSGSAYPSAVDIQAARISGAKALCIQNDEKLVCYKVR